jgi:hypothetical protein
MGEGGLFGMNVLPPSSDLAHVGEVAGGAEPSVVLAQ